MKLWKKAYQPDQLVEDYTVGNDYLLDNKLVQYDCRASIAHAKMLHTIDILSDQELSALVHELKAIMELHAAGKFIIKKSDEDCHTAIENHLVKKLGDTGKKIHTARSRNDQVLTALRLYYRDQLTTIKNEMVDFQQCVKEKANQYRDIKMPGFTHTRKAMITTVDTWIDAFYDAMSDNIQYLKSVNKLISQSPLGTGAGYGLPLPINRELTAKILGFEKVQKNPIYTQNSRGKFESLIFSLLSQIMVDLNKLSADLILFTMPGLDFFRLPDELTTGSSIMPQKKNPDVLELLRANYHKIISLEMRIKGMMANLIMGYHRDFQLFKEAIMEAFDLIHNSLQIATYVFSQIKVNQDQCAAHIDDEVSATEKVYQLVGEGIPFRDAYRRIAKQINE